VALGARVLDELTATALGARVLDELTTIAFAGALELLHFRDAGRARRRIGMGMCLLVVECFLQLSYPFWL
jgi:hypothetical protein